MRRSIVVGLLVVIGGAACEGSQPEQPETVAEQAQGSSVEVKLGDYFVEARPGSVTPGEVTFDVRNDSGNHDLYVLRTDLEAADLPQHKEALRPDVKALKPDLQAPGVEVVGSIEVLDEGGAATLTLDLESGHYVLICNLVDFEEARNKLRVLDSHYAQGMRTDFAVR